jgi:transposase
VCVLNSRGQVKVKELVATKISEFKRIIKSVPRPRQLVFEEGTQAAWLWSELQALCDDTLVCDPRQNRELSGQFKTDENDTRNLGLRAQGNLLKRVWHGGQDLQALKESVRAYQSLTQESVRLKNQLKAVFRSRGIAVGQKAYSPKTRKQAAQSLAFAAQRERVMMLGVVLDAVAEQRAKALKGMTKLARKNKMYKPLRKVDGIGPIFGAMFISEVGDAKRFRTSRQLLSYAGLAIMTHESSEYELNAGRAVRKARALRTRGLVRRYNRTLKYVFKQAAMTLSRTKWSAQYQQLCENSKNSNNAQLTLARKLAGVMLRIAKTGEKYDIAKVFVAKKSSS